MHSCIPKPFTFQTSWLYGKRPQNSHKYHSTNPVVSEAAERINPFPTDASYLMDPTHPAVIGGFGMDKSIPYEQLR